MGRTRPDEIGNTYSIRNQGTLRDNQLQQSVFKDTDAGQSNVDSFVQLWLET